MSLLSSGCILKFLLAGGEFTTADDFSVQIEADGLVGYCDQHVDEETSFIDCQYWTEGIPISQSSISLISNLGWVGVLIDPVILQVPEDVFELSGTFTESSTSTTGDLVITEANSFSVQPGQVVNPEQGQKFLILELPDGTDADGVDFGFELTFLYPPPPPDPFNVKAVFAGRVDVGGGTYYIPLLPCADDFTNVPEFTIPISETPQDLLPDLLDFALDNPDDLGCDGQLYDFTALGGPTSTPTGPPQANALWADDDCNLTVAATDALKKLQDIASIPYSVEPGCPTLGDVVGVQPAGFGQLIWGDADCDGDYDAVDALQVLRHIAGLPVNQTQPCPQVTAPVLLS